MEMCEYCGRFDDTVETSLSPFMVEVYGEEHFVTICDKCFMEELWEI